MEINYSEFRRRLTKAFANEQNSISYQLLEITDLFQKISSIYKFAQNRKDTSFQNPIIFQIVESALIYGVCVQIRRLANGKQRDEISLFKTITEMRTHCGQWTREAFVTWDGASYDPTALRQAHRELERQIISRAIESGSFGGWLPIGNHEEIERRHRIFDLLSGKEDGATRFKMDTCKPDLCNYLLRALKKDTHQIVKFANTFLAHRVQYAPDKQPDFDISLGKVRSCVISLWKCANVMNDIFFDSYTTPNIVHSLNAFDKLEMPLVSPALASEMLKIYESVKDTMERETSMYTLNWQAEFRTHGTAGSC